MPPRPSPSFALQVFGVPSVIEHGSEARLPLKRAAALLAYLAFIGRPVPRGHLATLLWPDADEARSRTRLRRLVYSIEEGFGDRVLAADADTLSLASPQSVEVDALRFAAFARGAVAAGTLDDATFDAARRWIVEARRPLLQGIAFGSEAFDDWLHEVSIEHEHLLARLLERLVEALADRRDFAPATELAEALIALDAYREPSHVVLMQLHALQGDRAGVEAAYARCAELLRAEFGIAPSAKTEAAYLRLTDDLRRLAAHAVERPSVRFAQSSHGAVAYTVLGTADEALVVCPGFVSHIEIALEHAPFRALVEVLAERFRVLLFDRRGVGLSERLGGSSTPAATADDIAAILDHAGLRRAWLFGSSEGGLGAMRFAIDRPDRVQGLCLFGALARGSAAPDYPWALPAAAYDVWLERLVAGWGGPVSLDTFAPSAKDDPQLRAWWARMVRHAASPGGLRAILGGLRDADMRHELGRIAAPTVVMHRRGDRAVRFEAGQQLAQNIPGAVWHPLEGSDHFWWCGDSAPVVQALVAFAAT